MTRRAAERRENPVGSLHAADVFRAGFPADEDHALAELVDVFLRIVGKELDLAGRRTRPGVDAFRQQSTLGDGLPLGFRVEDRLKQLVEVVRRNAPGGEPPLPC